MPLFSLFSASLGHLSVFGDGQDNAIEASRDAAGKLKVNGGAVPVVGGTPTVANTVQLTVFGLYGADTITLNETNGALPKASLFGGNGNDTITAGSGNDQLFGGSGNDTLIGGDGDDQMFGGAGNDRMVWNPGDDNDLMEGGAGIDTADVNGGNGAEVFTVAANGSSARLDRVDPAPFNLDIGTTENLVVNMNGGNDVFSATGNLAALIRLTVDGGAGNDTILGSNGIDLLLGGDGDDFIDGQQGNDTALLGDGEDVFQWNPGDGSDVVEGQDGTDTMLFLGANAAETINLVANGTRALFFRNVANVLMDSNDVEKLTFNALGGADTITVNDLSGTDVTEVEINLGALGGGDDGQADTVVINATGTDDAIVVVSDGAGLVRVLGLSAEVRILNFGAGDRLVINGQGGDDVIEASGLLAGLLLTADGGEGDDVMIGGAGIDVLTDTVGDNIFIQ
jgi:hypothetical protein